MRSSPSIWVYTKQFVFLVLYLLKNVGVALPHKLSPKKDPVNHLQKIPQHQKTSKLQHQNLQTSKSFGKISNMDHTPGP